ncbi:MAG: hypothetical protein LBB26_00880 [Puniceicoccales bacterium]|nr:hypothetical protein [Puniceicoccales bacterium]
MEYALEFGQKRRAGVDFLGVLAGTLFPPICIASGEGAPKVSVVIPICNGEAHTQ